MKRILSLVLALMLMASPAFAINDWKQGTATDAVVGTQNISDLDATITAYLQDPIDKVLADSIYGCTLTWASNSTVTVGVGECTISNAAGTIRRMRRNTSTATVNMATSGVGGIDSGSSEAASTWYAVYAVADADATTFTVICTQEGTALSDVTYYRYIGSFYNNASSNIANFRWFGKGASVLFMHDIPISLTTTASNGVWAELSCIEAIPTSSLVGIFGLTNTKASDGTGLWIRPDGSTWSTGTGNGLFAYYYGSAQRTCALGNGTVGTAQAIEYQTGNNNPSSMEITCEGFWLTR